MLKFSTTLEKNKIKTLAIGGFDGMHIAHQQLLSQLGEKGAVLVIQRDGQGLTPLNERCRYIDKPCIMIALSKIKMLLAEEFIHFLLREFPALEKIVVGYDFHFGKDRRADVHYLDQIFDGEVLIVDEVFYGDISVHSRYIKKALAEKQIKKANLLLGRTYSIKGTVIAGQGLGKKELFPTLNLSCGDFFLPGEGVYATHTKIDGQDYPSVTFIGHRKSTDAAFSVETHIVDEDISGDIKEVEVFFDDFLRENRKFENLGDLKIQISQDIKALKAMP